jgi:hypothetical protein
MRNLGELPEQQQGNLQILTGLQMQLQNTMAALGRARQQQVYLESLLSQYQNLAAGGVPTPGTTVASPAEAIKAELTRLQSEKANLLARYTPKYPDVGKIDEQIKETEALLAAATVAVVWPDDPVSRRAGVESDAGRACDLLCNATPSSVHYEGACSHIL